MIETKVAARVRHLHPVVRYTFAVVIGLLYALVSLVAVNVLIGISESVTFVRVTGMAGIFFIGELALFAIVYVAFSFSPPLRKSSTVIAIFISAGIASAVPGAAIGGIGAMLCAAPCIFAVTLADRGDGSE